MHMITNYCLS